ncbi:solute carrier family 22 member 18 [Lingula anatina]|uniref:Solute carrier family 22 member 18 n=1 Tax=Lingula anatina TaxID=7574 RepID=A0A1S3HTU8_LINAN|nr:solute carrier family 22 member 18 [Lingula anatina]|eukprot:XP_013389470.1 solute carrier family 22 member 18 [Lingula anatina]
MKVEVVRTPRKWSCLVINVHINMFLYATCWAIQTNTLPYLSKNLGADPLIFGYLQSTCGVAQLFGGILFGRFGDVFGSRVALTLAFLAAAMYYFMLGAAYSLPMLFASSLPSLLMHCMTGGQMVITDLTDSERRADALGKLWLSYGMGSVIGPFIGGFVNKHYSEQTAAFVACAGSMLSVVLVWCFVPHNTKKLAPTAAELDDVEPSDQDKEAVKEPPENKGSSVCDIKKLFRLLTIPDVGFFLAVKALSGMPYAVFQSMFPVVAMTVFNLPADKNGYILSYQAVLTMLSQGFGVGFLTSRFSDGALLKFCFVIFTLSYLLMALVKDVILVCIVSTPLTIGVAVLVVTTTSEMTKVIPEADTGSILGLSMAVDSLGGIISPTLGGFLLKTVGFYAFGYQGCICSLLVAIALFWKLKD